MQHSPIQLTKSTYYLTVRSIPQNMQAYPQTLRNMGSSFTVEEYVNLLHEVLQETSQVQVVDVRKGKPNVYMYTALEDSYMINEGSKGQSDTLSHAVDIFGMIDEFCNALEDNDAIQSLNNLDKGPVIQQRQYIASNDASNPIVQKEFKLADPEEVNGPTISMVFNAKGELQALPETDEAHVSEVSKQDIQRGTKDPSICQPLPNCPPCGRTFPSSSSYNYHMSMHQMNIKMANEALCRVGRGTVPKSLRALRVM